jgi:hypothetical protein
MEQHFWNIVFKLVKGVPKGCPNYTRYLEATHA